MIIAGSATAFAVALNASATRWAAAGALLIGLGAGISRIWPEFSAMAPQGEPQRERVPLRVLTHNVLVTNQAVMPTIAAIARSGADVVLLQETDGTVREALASLRSIYPYGSKCAYRCSLKILSKRPIVATAYRIRDAAGGQIGPPLVWLTTTAPDGLPVTLISLHYPWPVPPGRQRDLRLELAAALQQIDTQNVILAGDMNLTPWTYAMERQDAMLRPMTRITRGRWSWPSRIAAMRWPMPILPIDQIYAGSAWRAVKVETLAATGSDHLPVLATLERR